MRTTSDSHATHWQACGSGHPPCSATLCQWGLSGVRYMLTLPKVCTLSSLQWPGLGVFDVRWTVLSDAGECARAEVKAVIREL